MKSVIILTGSEPRHTFLRKAIALAQGYDVVRTYCEGLEQSLDARLERRDAAPDGAQSAHVAARGRSEQDFFALCNHFAEDRSHPVFVPKGAINDAEHTEAIRQLNPDLLAAFGCSLIKDPLIAAFPRRLLNVHLGLSPYYRGSGTNFFPLVDGRPEYVGATFMYLDAGIDTGEIIHQIRARIFPGDTPHQIGNRLIGDVAVVYGRLLQRFDALEAVQQPAAPPDARLCKRADFTEEATAQLYQQFQSGMVERYLAEQTERCAAVPIVSNPVLTELQT
jgi:methionyl-tRNA formyltransferase